MKITKFALLGLLIGIFVALMVYLAFALGQYDLSPKTWNADARGFCAAIMLMCIVLIPAGIVAEKIIG